MPKPAATATNEALTIPPLQLGKTRFRLIGTRPFFQHRMAEKAKQELLAGGRRKTSADRAIIKHSLYEEFRSAAEVVPDDDFPTAIGMKTVMILDVIAKHWNDVPTLKIKLKETLE
jgi:hypothetical protein